MNDISRSRAFSLLGSAVALGITLVLVFVICAVIVMIAPGVQFAHSWVALFTLAPLTTAQAWLEGIFFSLGLGVVAGAIFAAVHNAVAGRGL